MSLDTRKLANKIASGYGTRDPYEIADCMGIIVLRLPLGKLRGMENSLLRNKFIYINEALDEQQSRIVCAHELGHHIMHKDQNRIFMDTCTLQKTDIFEMQAERFAVDLLFEDSDLSQFAEYGIDTIARCLGIREEMAEYRMANLEIKLY